MSTGFFLQFFNIYTLDIIIRISVIFNAIYSFLYNVFPYFRYVEQDIL